ncbi:heparan-alpha-glucosaminide N-acetyltransferase domain-containing protein [Marinimicrobium locisalis]|uniref:heparan-alpha-glucosaminide N-acetyltransferase domain-containing protein n=1 Tax=Marinimicrobium locisalis TaxID=546022 RepID=UPI003221F267
MNTSRVTEAAALPANLPRIATFDLIRGLAVVFMIVIHVLDFYGAPEVHESLVGVVLAFAIGWPAASVFVFVMGIFVTYSSKRSLARGLKRAASLFLLGYLLNLARGSIPMWASLQMGLVSHEELGAHSPLTEFLIFDILQFAGLALALCVLLKHFLPRPEYWLAASLLVIFCSPFFWTLSSGFTPVDEFFKMLGGDHSEGAMFPLFPWLAYPLAGMAFGQWLREAGNNRRLFQKTLWFGLALFVVGGLAISTSPEYHVGHNLRSGPGVTLVVMGFVLVTLWACQWVTERAHGSRWLNPLYFWGKYVTAIYVTQWVLIGWGLLPFGLQQLNWLQTFLMMLTVLVLSDVSVRSWLWFRQRPLRINILSRAKFE